MKLAFVFVAIRGRYLIPFVPTLLALGTAYWMRQPSRFRRPALALTLLLPLLAHLPLEGSDIALTRGYLSRLREATRSGSDDVALYMPRTEADFQELIERFPVEYTVLGAGAPPLREERFARDFRAWPECRRGESPAI